MFGIGELIIAGVIAAVSAVSIGIQVDQQNKALDAQKEMANKQKSIANDQKVVSDNLKKKQEDEIKRQVGSALLAATIKKEQLQNYNLAKTAEIATLNKTRKGVSLAIRPYGTPAVA